MTDTSRGGVQGWKEFLAEKHDLVRSYLSASEKAAGRQVPTEPGVIAEGVFRRWLEGFLPGRYGVTSGYVISQGLSDRDPVRHFDVIIYDKLESPVLWRDGNPDRSDQGWSRPIPAEYVLCVLEVKATLTRDSANKAIKKLRELQPLMGGNDGLPYPIYLPPQFSCGVVFFRVDSRKKANILMPLIAGDLRGYFGGLVLSSTQDPLTENAGRIQLLAGQDSFVGTPETILSGFVPTASVQLGDVHMGAVMEWNPNSFVQFAYGLIGQLRGTSRPGFVDSFHGMSFQNGEAWRASSSPLRINVAEHDG